MLDLREFMAAQAALREGWDFSGGMNLISRGGGTLSPRGWQRRENTHSGGIYMIKKIKFFPAKLICKN